VTPARVLIVDDSALMRELLSEILRNASGLEVVGVANDPVQALPLILRLRPDVLTLDVEMPKQDGLSFLAELMRVRPMPVVMVSSITERGSELALKALELGAVDVVEKPKLDLRAGIMLRADELISKVRAAATARPRPGIKRAPRVVASTDSASAPSASSAASGSFRASQKLPVAPPSSGGSVLAGYVIAIGASTGGTEALAEFLSELPAASPPLVIVQHMPLQFTGKFASRLDAICRIRVREAQDGDSLLPGVALLAPGGRHLRVVPGAGHYVVRLSKSPENSLHCPSIDVMFDSVASCARTRGIGVILTGMGADGARGLLAMRKAGARTFAQDEATCVVFGMPKEAIACGAVERVLPLSALSHAAFKSATVSKTG
jgi:two-component system, chemotaxis family, protein-glutamate methylesterase/glutaminase